jgi:hypothetical protein
MQNQQQPSPYPNIPPVPPPPPPTPPKQSFWRRKAGCMPLWLLLVIGGSLCGIASLCGIVGAVGNSSSSTATNTQATSVPTRAPAHLQATIAPTHPKPTSTPTNAPVEDARLGASLNAFIAHYGTPVSTNNGLDIFKNGISATQAGTDLPRVEVVSQSAPNNKLFTAQEAQAACMGFLPQDAISLHKHVTRYNSDGSLYEEEYVYHSASMAKLFPASMFTDQNNNPTSAGTIALTSVYPTADTSGFVECDAMIGMY